ncbi:hypothetical protein BDN72DRAFT_904915 [Pluteus cervinus]|uniref:Uncharacterized protein n=1 Tax=Pluteus cervinus TaxID=181527 RepID=A0ACD3A3U5_9AGAR|nr:hypothetical protein BDN72DRAFT_904915 [Pluteus cervinus]
MPLSLAPDLPLPLSCDVQILVAEHMLNIIPITVYHQLLDQHPVFRRWAKRSFDCCLHDDDDIKYLAFRVRTFYRAMEKRTKYSHLRFANLNVLELPIPETPEVVASLVNVFVLVQPVELNLLCGHNPEFPATLSLFTPHLPHLRKLRIKYDRYASQGDSVYPWMTDSWNMSLVHLTGLRMFLLDTPLALDSTTPSEEWTETEMEHKLVSELAAVIPSLDRIYLLYAYDEELGRGDEDRIGMYERYIKDPDSLPNASFPWVHNPIRSSTPWRFMTPFYYISRIPQEDEDVFGEE